MKPLAAAALAASVLAHALLGCCWHHAHSATSQAVAAACDHHICVDQDADHGTPAVPGHPDCEEDACVFVQTKTCQSLDLDLDSLAALPTASGSIANILEPPAPSLAFSVGDAPKYPVPCRLFCRILLI